MFYEEESGKWVYKKGNQRFAIGTAAEGVKKIGILDTLLGNRSIGLNSVIFIDEPESALHPHAISTFLEIIASLAMRGIQFCYLQSLVLCCQESAFDRQEAHSVNPRFIRRLRRLAC